MDLKRLRTFVTIAELGTVSKAAEALRITQPALSRQIGSFEQELGFKLFERSGRRLLVTPRGEQLLGECREIVDSANTLRERAQSLRRGDIRTLKVATSGLTIEAVFPRFLKRYAERVPDVQLSLIEAHAADHLKMLESGEAHLAINVIDVLQAHNHRFGCYPLPRFQMLAACAPTYEIGSGDSIEIGRLARHQLLLLDKTYATRDVFDAACRLANVTPNVFIECGAAHALVALAEASHGVAVIPSILRTDPRRIRVLHVTHRQEPLELTLAVLWDKRRTLPRYAKEFSDLLAEYVREVFPISKPSRTKAAASVRRIAVIKSRAS